MSATLTPERSAIDPAYTWDLSAIFPSWEAWEAAMADLEQRIGAFKALAGTLGQSGAALCAALQAHDAIGQLSYRVWYYPSLSHDEDQRDNVSAARRQRASTVANCSESGAFGSVEGISLPGLAASYAR